MIRRQKVPKLVNLAVMTTITIFVWIFFDVYRTIRKTPDIDVDKAILEPIVPNLDTETLKDIEKGIYFEKGTFTFPTPTPKAGEGEKLEEPEQEQTTASPSSSIEL